MKRLIVCVTLVLASVLCRPQRTIPLSRVTTVNIFVKTPDKKAVRTTITLTSQKTGKTYKLRTDKNGLATMRSHSSETYTVSLKGCPDYDVLVAEEHSSKLFNYMITYDPKGNNPPKNPASNGNIQANTKETAVELKAHAYAGDTVYFTEKESGITHQIIIPESGQKKILLPKGKIYHVKWNDKVIKDHVEMKDGPFILTVQLNLGPKPEQFHPDSMQVIHDFQKAIQEGFDNPIEYTPPEKQPTYTPNSFSTGSSRPVKTKYSLRPTIPIIFTRNPQWNKILCVMDLTCSMKPYAKELAMWQSINFQKKEREVQFVFFNDGNGKPDSLKQTGTTGGIYYNNGENLSELRRTMLRAVSFGCSGEDPENDLEAIITGMKKAKDYEQVILIADNSSPIRDIESLNDIKMPIKIILCGSDLFHSHEHYINLAYKTGGSVHTVDQDIIDLKKTIEGQEITIYNTTYRLWQGRFLRMN